MTKQEAAAQRQKIAALFNEGKGTNEIARSMGVSKNTVIKVKRLMDDPNESITEDRREANGRPEQFDETLIERILAVREELQYGPRMLWAIMCRHPEEYGFNSLAEIPSPATIGRWLHERGLSRKAIGPSDKRGFPIDLVNDAGFLTIDGWGPAHFGSERLYLATVQDRFTRLGAAVPMKGAANYKAKSGMTVDEWTHAVYVGRDRLLGGESPKAIFTDNGIGMSITLGHTSQPVRHALKMGARMVYIPPAQPWRNGRLERFHWSMEREAFIRTKHEIKTRRAAVETLTTWLNWYNVHRPHGSLKDKAPGDAAPWFTPFTPDDLIAPSYERLDPQPGMIDCIRLCRNNGEIELWTEDFTRVSEVLGGQYLRVRFHLDPAADTQTGEIIWQQGKGKEAVIVATFNHKMDRPRKRGEALITHMREVDFTSITPPLHLSSKKTNWTRGRLTTNAPGSPSGAYKRSSADPDELAHKLMIDFQKVRSSLCAFLLAGGETGKAAEAARRQLEETIEQAEFELTKRGLEHMDESGQR